MGDLENSVQLTVYNGYMRCARVLRVLIFGPDGISLCFIHFFVLRAE